MLYPTSNQVSQILKKEWGLSKQSTIQGKNGSYKINRQKFLGRGGFGIVYVAIRCYKISENSSKNQYSYEQVVLKQFKRSDRWISEQDKDKQIVILQRFRKEWNNQYILPVIDIFQEKTTKIHYLVTAHATGGNLFERLKTKLDQLQMLNFVKRCAEILKYLHYDALKSYRSLEKGKEQKQTLAIIHRDVKPANIVFKDNRAYLIDFGVAKIGYANPQRIYSNCGTSNYKAPEVIEVRPYNAKVDIYSFGCTLYELFSGGQKLIGSAGLRTFGIQRQLYVKSRLIWLQSKLTKQQRYKYNYFWLQILNNCLAHNSKQRWSSQDLTNFLMATRMETYRLQSKYYFGEAAEQQIRYRQNKQIFDINFQIYRINLIQQRIFTIFEYLYFQQPKINKFMLYGILKNILVYLYDKYDRTKERCRVIKREDKVVLLKKLFDDRKLKDIRDKAVTKMKYELQIEKQKNKSLGNNFEPSLIEQIADRFPEILKDIASDPRRTLYEFCYQMRSEIVQEPKFSEYIALIIIMMEEPDWYPELLVSTEEHISSDPQLTSLKKLSRFKPTVEQKIKKNGIGSIFVGLRIENTVKSGQNREQSKTDIPIEFVAI